MSRRSIPTLVIARLATAGIWLGLWWWPVPEGLTAPAWHLCAIFVATILAVISGALPVLTASVLALAVAVLTGTLAPAKAYSGFANATILLIVIAFLVARAVVKSGLSQRIGHAVVAVFGRSTLGLVYSIFVVDGVIAPAFPSNTARSGVLYPLVFSLAGAAGARPDDPSRRRVGALLMFSGIASLSLSSALWFTAMAGNPLGAAIARPFGVDITFGSWLLAASVPALLAMILLPMLLYKVMAPEVTATPDAPAAARAALSSLGPLSREERIVAVVFIVMVVLWGVAATFDLDSTAVAFLGLGALLATGVLKLSDIAKEGDVLATYIWFAVLFTLSGQLNELGFMAFLGEKLATALGGLSGLTVGLLLVGGYVVLHYFFVSQTAHLLALFGVFLDVGVKLGVPAAPLAFQLLFATCYFSALAPQAAGANLLFAGSGFLTQAELYRLGAISTAFSWLLFLLVGLPWLAFVTG